MSGEHLRKSNWPECVPGPSEVLDTTVKPWGDVDDPDGGDNYPWTHPDASSIGEFYMGDVCPMCGVPLSGEEQVMTRDGRRGKLIEVSPIEAPVPTYHPDCHAERAGVVNTQLGDYE